MARLPLHSKDQTAELLGRVYQQGQLSRRTKTGKYATCMHLFPMQSRAQVGWAMEMRHPSMSSCGAMLPLSCSQAPHTCSGNNFAQSRRNVKTTTVRNAIKLRYGTFWNAKLAKRFNKPHLGRISDGTCPLCNNPDSGTHVLGPCSHRYLKGLYIEAQ